MTDGPGELHLVRHREVRFVLFVACVIAGFGIAAWVGTFATGGDTSGWAMAGAGITFLAGVALVLWIFLRMWLRTNERRHTEGVLADPIAVWPQYSTPAQWGKDVDAAVGHVRADAAQVIGPAAVFSVVVALIAIVTAVTGDAAPALVIGGAAVVAVWVIAVATILVRSKLARRAEERIRTRLSAIEPFPRCWVSSDGAYFEDTGLVRFDRFAGVSVVEPGEVSAHRKQLTHSGRTTGMTTDLTSLDTRLSKSGWALLAVTLDSSTPRTFWLKLERAFHGPNQRYDWVDTVHIRVPPDHASRAHDVAARIRRRWLG